MQDLLYYFDNLLNLCRTEEELKPSLLKVAVIQKLLSNCSMQEEVFLALQRQHSITN